MGRVWKYDDDWIKSHYDPNKRWRLFLKEYNETFGTNIGYSTFVSHMNRELNLEQNYCLPYTEEQDKWLRQNYPVYGRIESTKKFNQIFHDNKTPRNLQAHCHQALKIKVTRERKARSCVENHGRCSEIGSVSSGLFNVPAIKIKNGSGKRNWQRLDEYLIGKKEGMVIVHLDGNKENCELDNLMHAPRNILGTMGKEGFWSDNKEITRTGIIWCELFNVLKKEGENNYDYTEG